MSSSLASGACAPYSFSYMEYYNGARTHLSLNKDTPVPRAVRPLGAFSRNQFWVDCTISTCGFDFRKGQLCYAA